MNKDDSIKKTNLYKFFEYYVSLQEIKQLKEVGQTNRKLSKYKML